MFYGNRLASAPKPAPEDTTESEPLAKVKHRQRALRYSEAPAALAKIAQLRCAVEFWPR